VDVLADKPTNVSKEYTASTSGAEDEESVFLRNVGIYLQVHTELQPRRPTSIPKEPDTTCIQDEDNQNKNKTLTHCTWGQRDPGCPKKRPREQLNLDLGTRNGAYSCKLKVIVKR
jgi:hypothetical protein